MSVTAITKEPRALIVVVAGEQKKDKRQKLSSQEAKQKLADIVYEKQGLKGVELVSIFTSKYDCNESAPLLLDEMVRQRTIEEVEYCLPNMPTTIKSMFFPQGTRFI